MSRDEFDALVKRLEASAARRRSSLKWATAGWAALGFGFLLLVMVGSIVLTLGLLGMIVYLPNALTLKLGIVGGLATGGVSWAIFRSLFVRMEAPEGLRLRKKDAPALLALIDELRRELRGPRFHRVLLVGDHNAAVVQMPRLGVFGWHRNYLLVGLPLMQGVSVEEFRAILAHEFAHLSGAHGKFSAWLYRLRKTWQQLFEREHAGGKILGNFVLWFWPRFNARAFVLSRAQEYEADALAAEITSPSALARGLIRTQVQGRWLADKFWPDVYGRVRDQAAPPSALLHELGGRIGALHEVPEIGRWLTQAYNLETNNSDTHPCLKDRLRALPGLPPELSATVAPADLPPLAETDAATALLGDQLDRLASQLETEWQTAVKRAWTEGHKKAQKIATELAEVEAASAGAGSESPAALWKRIELRLQRDDNEAVQPLVEQMLALEPEHAAANFVRGRFLLGQEEARGVEYVERALSANPFMTMAGCEVLYGYYERNGMRAEMKTIEKRVEAHESEIANAQAERSSAKQFDPYIPPDLTPEQKATIVACATPIKDIEAVHVARKKVRYFPQQPMFVVAIKIGVSRWVPRGSSANEQIVQRMLHGLELPGNFLVFVVEKDLVPLGKSICAVGGSEVYNRNSVPPPLPGGS